MIDKGFFDSMLDYLHEGVYFVDRNRQILSWNKSAERITGYSAKDMLYKHCFNNILNHIDENGVQLCIMGCPLHAALVDGISREARVYLHHKEGYRLPVKVKTMPVYDDLTNEIVGAAEVFIEAFEFSDVELSKQELVSIAYTDQLTKLGNRRATLSYLSKMHNDFKNDGITYSVAMIDIDFFKKVNDTYGHNVGDKVLYTVATTLRNAFRIADHVGRWGGEEFMVVMQGIPRNRLEEVLEKARKLVEGSKTKNQGNNIGVTISIGSATSRKGESINSIIKRADEKLYEAKNAGRNKTILSDE